MEIEGATDTTLSFTIAAEDDGCGYGCNIYDSNNTLLNATHLVHLTVTE